MRSRLFSFLGAALALTLWTGVDAWAAEAPTVQFGLPAQPLGDALRAVGDRGDLNIFFDPRLVEGMKAAALSGSYTLDEALKKLLEPVGLKAEYLDSKTVAIRLATTTSLSRKGRAIEGEGSQGVLHLAQNTDDAGEGQNTESSTHQEENKSSEGSQNSNPETGVNSAKLQEIVVTGSRLSVRGVAPADIRILDRTQIEQSGQSNLADYLNTIPSASSAAGDHNSGKSFLGSTVQLRGLPLGTTLVLLNGRRLEASGLATPFDFFDLNNIPLSAIEKIEVLSSGSSAVYGSDAIAGVVNVILRKNVQGAEGSFRFGHTSGQNEYSGNFAIGVKGERGAASLVGSYFERGELGAGERKLTSDNDYTAYGGTNNNLTLCHPGNVFATAGSTLTALGGANFAAVPRGLTGTPTTGAFSSTAGTLNSCGVASNSAIIPSSKRIGALIQAHYELSDNVEVFSDVVYSRIDQYQYLGYQGLFGIPGFQSFTAAANNPFNPFGQRVGVSGIVTGLARYGDVTQTDFIRPVAGLRGTLSNDWHWEVSGALSLDKTRDHQTDVTPNNAAIQAALNSTDPATALNPFIDGPLGSPALLDSLFSDSLVKYEGQIVTGQAVLNGNLGHLPAGPVAFAMGGEFNRTTFNTNRVLTATNPPNTKLGYNRENYAAFGEARVPLISGGAGESSLALSLAGRLDDYSDFGTTGTYRLQADSNPVSGLVFSASYSTAFKAPSLFSLYSPQRNSTTLVTDPRINRSVTTSLVLGGNPDLDPQDGRSWSAGFVYLPPGLRGAKFAASAWSVKLEDAIQSLSPQFLVNNESIFSSRITRDGAGNISRILATQINYGSLNVAGIDFAVDYRLSMAGIGDWSIGSATTYTCKYDAQLLPGIPATDRVSWANLDGSWAPRWKGNVNLGLQTGPVTLSLIGRYVGSYHDYGVRQKIGNFWLVDASTRYGLGAISTKEGSILNRAFVQVGASNLFNKAPQFSRYSNFYGYDPAQADIRGRFVYLQIGIAL